MCNRQPLHGETVVFTGTPKSEDVFDLVQAFGGMPVSLPLIKINELCESTDELRLKACPMYDWLIFTSQSAVSSFASKLERHSISHITIASKIAAVGTRTAAALEKIGFTVDFIPTIFSADTFVKEFNPSENTSLRLLFLRGSIAGNTIKEELPFEVDEWTVYSTEKAVESIGTLIDLLKRQVNVTILFASPSAVEVFTNEVAPHTTWDGYTIGAIGHVTEQALIDFGAPVHVTPATYTLIDLVNELAKRKER